MLFEYNGTTGSLPIKLPTMSQVKNVNVDLQMESDIEELITKCAYNSLDDFESQMKSIGIDESENHYDNDLLSTSVLPVADFYRSSNAVVESKESSYWENLNKKVSSQISSLASKKQSESSLSSEETSLLYPVQSATLLPNEGRGLRNKKLKIKDVKSKERILKPPIGWKLKITAFHDKIYNLLDKIGNLFENPPPDTDEDLASFKRQKRDAEFTSRFARNYLYELTRNIRDFIGLLSGKSKNDAVFDKVICLHQIAFQGLQAYVKHLPLTMTVKLHDRVRQFLLMLVELLKLCSEYNICVDLAGIQSKIYILIVNDTQPIVKTKKTKRRKQKRNILSKRLSMYKEANPLAPFPYNNITTPLAVHLNGMKSLPLPSGTIVRDPDVKTMMDSRKNKNNKEVKRGYVADISNFLSEFDLKDPAIYDTGTPIPKVSESEDESKITTSSPLITSPGDSGNEINIQVLGVKDSHAKKNPEVPPIKKRSDSETLFSSDSLLGALEYRNKLENLMSKYKYFFPTGEIPWGITSLIVNQLMNQSIIDIAKKQDIQKPVV